MSGAAQVIEKVCEWSSLFKLRRELTSTPGPLPEVLQKLYQACAAATGKELASDTAVPVCGCTDVCVYTPLYVPALEG